MKEKYVILNNIYRLNNGTKFILTNMPELITQVEVKQLLVILDEAIKENSIVEYNLQTEIDCFGLKILLASNSGVLYLAKELEFNKLTKQLELKGFVVNRIYTMKEIVDILAKLKIDRTRQAVNSFVISNLNKGIDYKKGKEYKFYDSALRRIIMNYAND